VTEWVRPNCPDGPVTLCARILKDLKHFAANIDTDLIDFGGVERGSDAGNGCSQLLFWNSTFSQFLLSPVVLWSSGASPGGSRRCRAASKEVPRGQGKPRAPEWWPESSGRGLDDDFPIEAFSCDVWLFSVLVGRLQVFPGGVELRPRRSQELRESQELQMGSLRALEEAWTMTLRLRHFSVKSGHFLCFRRCRAGGWRVAGAGGQV
jgi:hypothetical protein